MENKQQLMVVYEPSEEDYTPVAEIVRDASYIEMQTSIAGGRVISEKALAMSMDDAIAALARPISTIYFGYGKSDVGVYKNNQWIRNFVFDEEKGFLANFEAFIDSFKGESPLDFDFYAMGDYSGERIEK